MRERLEKFVVTTCYIILVWLTIAHFIPPWNDFLAGCLLLSGLWLGLTALTFRHLFITYVERVSQIKFRWQAALGVLLALPALVFGASALTLPALAILAVWTILIALQIRNRRRYVVKGFGLLPRKAWVNPPAEALREGDVILTNGVIARRTKNSVGHMELVLKGFYKGKEQLIAFSAYMEKGVVIHTLRALLKAEAKASHYIVMRPRVPWTAEQNQRAFTRALQMLAVNEAWTESETRRRTALVEAWLPDTFAQKAFIGRYHGGLKAWALKKYLPTGYDWLGMYMGTHFDNRWTCMGACLEVIHHAGIKTRSYGTGLAGLGTGLGNPLMPIRFMCEPTYRLLTLDDETAYAALAA